MRTASASIPLAIIALGLAACPGPRDFIECVDQTSCGLAAGGQCLVNPATGHQFCAYPDSSCPGGFRWSDYDVESSISGTCVSQDTDAGIDAPAIDATDGAPDAAGVSQWARAFGGAGNDELLDLAVASDQGVVIAGWFEQSISFGGPSLTAQGGRDVFVAKLSAAGDHVWSKRFGGGGSDVAYSVALDATGNAYVIGTFVGVVDFDGQQLGSGTAASEFLVKLDGTTGASVWAVRLGGALADRQDLAVTADGESIAVGAGFFGTINLGGSNLTSAGSSDVVLARFNGAGQHVWSRSMGGTGTDMGNAVAFLPGGDVAIAGGYRGPAAFGAAQPLAAAGGAGVMGDAFVARYASANGAHVWSFGYGANNALSSDEFLAVAVDATAIYAGGHFGSTASFGGASLTANGSDDGILAKYDAGTGAHIWSRQFGGSSYETVQEIVVDGTEVWFGGYFSGTINVGSSTLTSAGVSDIVYGRAATTTGDFMAGGSAGGAGPEDADGFGLSPSHVWIGGTFSTGFPVFGANLSPAALSDVFVGRTAR